MKPLFTGTVIFILFFSVVIAILAYNPASITPDRLMRNVIDAQSSSSCHALQLREIKLYNRELKYRIEMDKSGDVIHFAESDKDNNIDLPAENTYEKLLIKNYRPYIVGEDKIAGRRVWAMYIKSWTRKDFSWRQLWVDQKTYVVLAQRDWSSSKKIKSSMRTLKISYLPSIHRSRKSFPLSKPDIRFADASEKLGWNPIKVKYLPPGYQLVDVKTNRNKHQMQMIFSDGLCVMSIFITNDDIPSDKENANNIRTWGQGLILSKTTNGQRAVIVADLPEKEILKVAQSID